MNKNPPYIYLGTRPWRAARGGAGKPEISNPAGGPPAGGAGCHAGSLGGQRVSQSGGRGATHAILRGAESAPPAVRNDMGLPWRLLDTPQFHDFIFALRPAYANRGPIKSKAVSTTALRVQDKQVSEQFEERLMRRHLSAA